MHKPHECIYIDKTFEPSWSYEASFLPPSQRCPPIDNRYCPQNYSNYMHLMIYLGVRNQVLKKLVVFEV